MAAAWLLHGILHVMLSIHEADRRLIILIVPDADNEIGIEIECGVRSSQCDRIGLSIWIAVPPYDKRRLIEFL